MGHDHHHHDHSTGNIRVAFFLNLFFALVEFVGGWYTNSIAIISDAVHDLGDSLSLGVAWYFQKLSKKGRDDEFSYGYRRFSILGAVINALVLTTGSVLVIVHAIPRLFDPVMPDADGMILLAIGGIIVNGLAAFKLSHGHSLNERVVYLHLLEDILGWIATLIVAVVLKFRVVPVLDPALSLLISGYILFNVYRNLKASVVIFLQGTPGSIRIKDVHKIILNVPGVLDFHDCHLWTMDGNYHVLSVHIVVDENKRIEELAKMKSDIKSSLSSYHIDHITIEFETVSEDCDAC